MCEWRKVNSLKQKNGNWQNIAKNNAVICIYGLKFFSCLAKINAQTWGVYALQQHTIFQCCRNARKW